MNLTDIHAGLSSEYAASHSPKRKKKEYKNLRLACQVLWNQVSSIFFILLLASAFLSFAFSSPVDGWIFVVINLANVFLGFLQEFKASKASQLLEGMIEHTASVIRDGALQSVKSDELVEGDILSLAPGDILVADILVRECSDAFVDMSILTGESAPSEVREGASLNAGCSVSSGRVIGQVTSAGASNSLKKYSDKLSSIKKSNSFARFISNVSMNILFVTLFSILLIGIFGVLVEHKYSVTEFVLYSIAMLVGVVPESLPLIITLMLTREALQLAKQKVIVKNLSSLQQLGSIKYLLTDKTGTLTENNIKVSDVSDVKDARLHALRIARSEYEKTPMDLSFDHAILQSEQGANPASGAPMDKPIVSPFRSNLGYAGFVFPDISIIRGQFTSVTQACGSLSGADLKKYEDLHASYEDQGLRVIAFASKATPASTYLFDGFYVFEDPLKADASHSYRAAEGLGISVKVLTGDSPRVALYVGRQLDPQITADQVCSLDVTDIATLSEKDFNEDKIYARCHPEHKLALIDTHEKHGAVGFLGEGINDALALKRADVGMVVYNASDVARQSADILLMEKSLNPVIEAIQMSRKAYAHIFTYLLCTLTGNIGTLFSLTVIALFWTDIPMLPVQILLNNLLTDVPLLLLVTDRLSKGDYKKPIDHSARQFFRRVTFFALISTGFDMIYFFIFKDQDITILRTGWFIFSVLCELILVLSLRSEVSLLASPKMTKPLAGALGLCALVALALPYVPYVSSVFHLYRLSTSLTVVILLLVLLYMTTNEAYKYISRRFFK